MKNHVIWRHFDFFATLTSNNQMISIGTGSPILVGNNWDPIVSYTAIDPSSAPSQDRLWY